MQAKYVWYKQLWQDYTDTDYPYHTMLLWSDNADIVYPDWSMLIQTIHDNQDQIMLLQTTLNRLWKYILSRKSMLIHIFLNRIYWYRVSWPYYVDGEYPTENYAYTDNPH